MSGLDWRCDGPGSWSAGDYVARRTLGGSNPWEVRYQDESLYRNFESLTECKRAAQAHADSLRAVDVSEIPVKSVKQVEVIDNRPHTNFRGKAFVARDVDRAVLTFDDDTLKVTLT